MKVLLQRITDAQVRVAAETVGAIDAGLLVFIGIEDDDDEPAAQRMARRVAGCRLFSDPHGKMNLDVRDVGGSVLVVSQFTLAADTGKGRRPGFSRAAAPPVGKALYDCFVATLEQIGLTVATGRFGANMQVSLTNDGPVTFLLES